MRCTRRRRRPQPTGELGRLLDAYPGSGAPLTFSADGRTCAWLEGSCCAPGQMVWESARFDVAALKADAAAAGMDADQLADSLARIETPEHAIALARAAGREVVHVPPPAEVARVAARQLWPSLHVRRSPVPLNGCRWWWEVVAPDGRTLAPRPGDDEVQAVLPSQPAALEVGLAHLAVVTASWAIDVHGAQLPPEFERIPAG